VKKGIASSKSLERIEKIRNGKFAMYCAGKKPREIAINPEANPRAANENATGNPINMTMTRLANIRGAMFCIVIMPLSFYGSQAATYRPEIATKAGYCKGRS
jgi:hypothetical protein